MHRPITVSRHVANVKLPYINWAWTPWCILKVEYQLLLYLNWFLDQHLWSWCSSKEANHDHKHNQHLNVVGAQCYHFFDRFWIVSKYFTSLQSGMIILQVHIPKSVTIDRSLTWKGPFIWCFIWSEDITITRIEKPILVHSSYVTSCL